MELVDLYNEDRIPLGITMERYDHRTLKEQNACRVVVHVCIFNLQGQMLIQQRSLKKAAFPGKWDVSAAGGVNAGETSRQAAEREVREELGYELDLTGIRASMTVNYDGGFDDFYLVVRDDLQADALVLQEEEVTSARWATEEEVLAMLEQGEFVHYPAGFLHFLFEMQDQFGF